MVDEAIAAHLAHRHRLAISQPNSSLSSGTNFYEVKIGGRVAYEFSSEQGDRLEAEVQVTIDPVRRVSSSMTQQEVAKIRHGHGG